MKLLQLSLKQRVALQKPTLDFPNQHLQCELLKASLKGGLHHHDDAGGGLEIPEGRKSDSRWRLLCRQSAARPTALARVGISCERPQKDRLESHARLEFVWRLWVSGQGTFSVRFADAS